MVYTLAQGEFLTKLARKVIKTYLAENIILKPPADTPEVFFQKSGVFVTLKKADQLRGCIGRPYPNQKLIDAIIASSVDSATRDPRFPRVTEDELEKITIEITILTPPEKIIVSKPQEYLKKIEIGRDGLIISQGRRGGLLLPQVPVDWNWDVSEFLEQTSLKAGLRPDAWLDKETEIFKFQGVIFQEKSPGGEIVPKKIQKSSC
ncbi:MAG: TIGR00296 family protein [Candidatus Hermodarchaeota archaeon]